jgi:endonuclease/exonuclease/phosphatase family metal-dependent hydrolase
MSFGVLTLNLWNINEPLEVRYCALETGLRLLRPDIVCLQEVSRDPTSGRSQAELIAKMCNSMHCVEENGLATLSSHLVVRSNSVALPDFPGDATKRQVLLAHLLIEGRPLLVANTHLASPPEMVQERRKQAEALMAAIEHHCPTGGGAAKILCGDLNDVAESPAVRAVLDSEEKFHDVFAECHPNIPGFTYACKNQYVDPYWTKDQRIDYIFANSELVPKSCSVVFDGNNGLDLVSDHFGVFCHFAFR